MPSAHANHSTAQLTSEVVSLSLDEVCGQYLGTVAVKEGEGGREGRDGDAPEPEVWVNYPPSRGRTATYVD